MQKDRTGASAQEGPLVVIIEDDATASENLALFFSERGLRVRTFSSPLEALETLRSGAPPALVVTDYRMPQMDGLAFIEALRGLHADVPVILMTAHGGVDTYLRSMSLGVFEYINKPVSLPELERIATMALGRPMRKGNGSP